MVKTLSTPKGRFARLTRLTQAALMACALAGSQAGFAQISNPFGGAIDALKKGVTSTIGNIVNPGAAASAPASLIQPASPGTQTPTPATSQGSAVSARNQFLFNKGTVTGEDLYESFKAMRQELQDKRSAAAWAQLSLTLDKTLTTQNLTSGLDFTVILQQVATNALIEMMKSNASNVAMKTLDDYLQYLLDERRSALAEETIKLPRIPNMTNEQATRIVNMATMIVGARLSNKILDKAEQDFKSLEVDYKVLLEQREKAANLLFATIDQRRAAMQKSDNAQRAASEGDMKRELSDRDIAFIDSSLNRMTLKEFSKDMAAQNLALEYMRSKDPAAFKDYRTTADDVVRRTSAYVRTVSGVAAFSGLTVSFGHAVTEIARENNLNNLLLALPLGVDFVRAAAPLGAKSVQVSLYGVVLPKSFDPFHRNKYFAVSRPNKSDEVVSSKEVFKFIQDSGVSDQFVGALFLDDSAGWLNRIRLCDPLETGRMIDATMSREERTKFASEYFAWTDARINDFSFQNGLERPGPTAREREMPNELLGKDRRRERELTPLPNAQRAVEKNYGQWSDEQLLRIIFHNREGGAAYATLDVGDVSIRPIPSPESVYAYESRVEACRKVGDQSAAMADESPPPQTVSAKTSRNRAATATKTNPAN